MDDWLRKAALQADDMGTSRTYVWLTAANRFVAYFALVPHVVRREELPGRLARGGPNHVPAILLGKLALDKARQGGGEGRRLLVDALTIALQGISVVGGRVIVVDATNERAAAFYEKHGGFIRVPGNELRLLRKAADIAVSLRLRWP
ncbi:MAG: GNAT family N-acetyltransferase [Actinobacteria bacterium]|nr:GNAT family N-acetyltransferase [Actinomycetota bacterium]